MSEYQHGACIYLIDDLPSELDVVHCQRVCGILSSLEAQVFVTGVDRRDVLEHWPDKSRLSMFHVEQGSVTYDKSPI